MQILITFLTVVLVLNCLFLMLLVLIQLPKKEAGIGVAFGGGATDALFGAGSGNALTKLTKYSSATFLGLSLALGIMNSNRFHASESEVRKALAAQRPATTAPVPAAAPAKPASPFQQLAPSTNLLNPSTTSAATTNAAARPAVNTNTAPAK